MAYSVETRTANPATLLREALDKAERMVVQLDGQNIEQFLVLLDDIEGMLEGLAQDQADVRPEEVRWQSLLNRIDSKPGDIAGAAAVAGGLSKLRTLHPPAESFWWHLDAEVGRRRKRAVTRALLSLGAIVLAVAVILWAINFFFPPNPQAIAMVETTNRVDQLIMEQRWDEALAVVQQARQTMPDEAELAAWEVVLNERLGDTEAAAAAFEEAQALLANHPVQLWLLLGTNRLMVGDLDGAEAAGREAEALDPDEAQVYFLLGGVAEARGDVASAIEFFDKTFQVAGDENPQLAVIARVRMGQLLQRPDAFTSPVATPTLTP
jgi:tetratricopeptide (TPR) repeat protein